MATNFSFLKKVDKDLFEIIETAEKLYRDEYFEQCMTQTRRFGESVCKKVLNDKYIPDSSFDNMLATLKDSAREIQEREFIDDLYFLKKHGNKSTHSLKVQHDGMEALECLQRAFEVAISYCVYNKNGSKQILKRRYDTELLITGEKSKQTLAEKYKEAKKKLTPHPIPLPQEREQKQYSKIKSKKQKNKISVFWTLVGISAIVSAIMLISIILIVS